jgi:RNA-binding protein
MPAPELTGKQRRYLRALGHGLRAVAQVGREGLSDGFIAAVDRALTDHELVKVKLGLAGDEAESGLDRHAAADQLAARTESAIAQVLGGTVLLYRPHPDEPRIALP